MSRAGTSAGLSIAWIRPLAAPYLPGYRAMAERHGSLQGYWFLPSAPEKKDPRGSDSGSLGFFVGYLLSAKDYAFLSPQPPECLVFAFVKPVRGPAHRRLVREPGSLVRKTAEYIRWLTHRPPRFAFHEDQVPALVRHGSMRDWPSARHEHFSRNFFIETLAWLVRSALVRRFLAEGRAPARAGEAARVNDSRRRRKSSLSRRSLSR